MRCAAQPLAPHPRAPGCYPCLLQDNWERFDGDTPAGNCNSGHLDFDVYPTDGNIGNLQVSQLTWRAVDCPVDELPLQFAFSSTSASSYFFAVHVWDARAPLVALEVSATKPGGSVFWAQLSAGSNGWSFQPPSHSGWTVAGWPNSVSFRLTSVHGESLVEAGINVPVGSWKQLEQWVAWPPAEGKSNFATAPNPPSPRANEFYRHCVKPSATARPPFTPTPSMKVA